MFDLLIIAKEQERKGESIIHLELGEPAAPPPSEVVRATKEAIERGKVGYTPPAGIHELREAIAELMSDVGFGFAVDIDDIAVVTANLSLFQLLSILCDPGEKVATFCPFFPTYSLAIAYAQATPHVVDLDPNNGFKLTIENVREALDSGAKVIIVNSCNNPTGVVYDDEVLLYLFCEAKKLGVWVISDSTYEFLRYKNNFCCSESHKLQAHENVVHLYSFSKLFNVPGYRLGFIVCADKGLMSKMIASNSALISCHSEFTQLGVLAGIPELRPFAANQARYYSNVVAEIGVAWPTLLDCIEAEPSSGFYLFLPIHYMIKGLT